VSVLSKPHTDGDGKGRNAGGEENKMIQSDET